MNHVIKNNETFEIKEIMKQLFVDDKNYNEIITILYILFRIGAYNHTNHIHGSDIKNNKIVFIPLYDVFYSMLCSVDDLSTLQDILKIDLFEEYSGLKCNKLKESILMKFVGVCRFRGNEYYSHGSLFSSNGKIADTYSVEFFKLLDKYLDDDSVTRFVSIINVPTNKTNVNYHYMFYEMRKNPFFLFFQKYNLCTFAPELMQTIIQDIIRLQPILNKKGLYHTHIMSRMKKSEGLYYNLDSNQIFKLLGVDKEATLLLYDNSVLNVLKNARIRIVKDMYGDSECFKCCQDNKIFLFPFYDEVRNDVSLIDMNDGDNFEKIRQYFLCKKKYPNSFYNIINSMPVGREDNPYKLAQNFYIFFLLYLCCLVKISKK